MEKPLEELVGKKIIVETFNGELYSGELVYYGFPQESKIKLKDVHILDIPGIENVFSLKEPEELEIPIKNIKTYEKVIPWHHPYFPHR